MKVGNREEWQNLICMAEGGFSESSLQGVGVRVCDARREERSQLFKEPEDCPGGWSRREVGRGRLRRPAVPRTQMVNVLDSLRLNFPSEFVQRDRMTRDHEGYVALTTSIHTPPGGALVVWQERGDTAFPRV